MVLTKTEWSFAKYTPTYVKQNQPVCKNFISFNYLLTILDVWYGLWSAVFLGPTNIFLGKTEASFFKHFLHFRSILHKKPREQKKRNKWTRGWMRICICRLRTIIRWYVGRIFSRIGRASKQEMEILILSLKLHNCKFAGAQRISIL